MKPPIRWLIGIWAIAPWYTAPTSTSAAVVPSSAGPAVAIVALGQSGSDPSTDAATRREVEQLLRRARAAMREGEFDVADSLLAEAEEANVSFGVFHLGDTPKKLRRDLERQRGRGTSPTLPSQRFSSPFAKKSPDADAAAAENPFGSREPAVPISMSDAKQKAHQFLLSGRRALAEGNVPAAEHWARKAAELDAPFGPNEDSPERLAADIREAGGSVEWPQSEGRADSPFATTDARTPEEAERSQYDPLPVRAAQPQRGVDSAFERHVISAPPESDEMGRNLLSGSPTAAPPRGPAASNTEPASDAAASDAMLTTLLLAARQAVAHGDLARAAQLTARAAAIPANYGPQDDSPERLSLLIGQVEAASRAASSDDPVRKRQYAELLFAQARILAAYRDYRTADLLVNQIEQLDVELGRLAAPLDHLRHELTAALAAAPHEAEVGTDATSPAPPATGAEGRGLAETLALLVRAREALAAGRIDEAEQFARQAHGLGVPDTRFEREDDRPGLVMLDIQRARAAATDVAAAGGPTATSGANARAVYDPRSDAGETRPAQVELRLGSERSAPIEAAATDDAAGSDELPFPPAPAPTGSAAAADLDSDAAQAKMLLERGRQALDSGDANTAMLYLRQAQSLAAQLDDADRRQLAALLSRVQASIPTAESTPAAAPTNVPAASALESFTAEQQAAHGQLISEIATRQRSARELQEKDPKAALSLLLEARQLVEAAALDAGSRQQLLGRVDRSIAEVERYIDQNRALIELDERNRAVYEQVQRDRQMRVEVDERLAVLIDEYNRLMDEQRFAEAELKVKMAEELAPNHPVVQQVKLQNKFVRRLMRDQEIRSQKEDGYVRVMQSVDEASTPFDDSNPHVFPEKWGDLTKRRRSLAGQEGVPRSPKELEIHQKLKTEVQINFQDAPLSQVLDQLAQLADINLVVDWLVLAEEGVMSDTPVRIPLSQPITLKSALNLILEPLRLSYVIKDEVLKVTSERIREGSIVTVTYNVADLVTPIPHFVPDGEMGLAGLINNAYRGLGYGHIGGGMGAGFGPGAVLANVDSGSGRRPLNPAVMAQMGSGPAPGMGGGGTPVGFGPGGLGGGAAADFDSLIDLIKTTISPQSWDDVGGAGAIEPFPTNLSLVISNTEEVHDRIVDLLAQLRRLQDLQVTIEVRFISLNDNFFERIGVDFDFDIDDNIDRPFQVFGKPLDGQKDASTNRDLRDRDHGPSVTVGQSAPGVFSQDLDIPFRQDSFALAVPQFGGFDAAAGASLGFAILSDLEAFFFINAAQGDRRTNVLQAPKVTLFNGQQAFVSDSSFTPFVISVIPVVADFAAALQPVIVVLSEGTFLTVQATVSNDRRFVRLTVVPYFSQITDRDRTFTFTGSTTSRTSNSSEGPEDDTTSRDNEQNVTTSGTTVQLPTLAQFTVTTTVSVPDGGTVLLGGIKRLNEGRNEFGVPILNKVPYINRLFKNVGIGRETQSLMMMVTPRIIIQEEEEALLGITPEAP